VDSDCQYLQKGGKLFTACVHCKKTMNESLQKECLKINESGERRSREPEVVTLQNNTQKCYISEITTSYKKVNGMMQHSHREESCHLTK
jgi:hypothetical protein